MDRMLVVVFDDEKKAYQGRTALAELHVEGSLSVYAAAVIAKGADGTIKLRQAAEQAPIGTAAGFATGSLIGMLGGPAGLAAGALTGTLGGSLFDLAQVGVDEDFLTEVSRKLTPGKAALVAEIEEDWVLPLDTRMEQLGGSVFRRARGEFVHAQMERQIAADRIEIETLKREFKRSTVEAKAKLQAKLEAARKRLQERKDRLSQHIQAIEQDNQAKIRSLREQATGMKTALKAEVEKRVEKVRKDIEAGKKKFENVRRHIREVANA